MGRQLIALPDRMEKAGFYEPVFFLTRASIFGKRFPYFYCQGHGAPL